ncbi:MAG: lipopolysaccharide biosynthesis protein [Propionibacterium sp.]|nr:lipopolysaccharide biosynthesis protein [Propionibacterium sp.]
MTQRAVVQGARGGGIVVAGSVMTALIQLAAVTILSRLLSPDDFGLVAMVTVFIVLGNLIRDFGMPTAALQAKDLSHQQASNLFWMNSGLAALAATLLVAAAPFIAGLYNEPRLIAIIPAMALVMFISGTGAQIQVHLARRMRYVVLVTSDVVSQSVALGAAILAATHGAGYWALVIQNCVAAATLLATRWIASRWVPSPFRRGHGSARLFRAGRDYGLAQLLTFLQSNADTFVIGTQLGASALGLYNRGYQLLTAPTLRLLEPLTQVIIPALNRAESEGRQRESILLRIQFVVGGALVWVFSIAAGAASVIIPLILGPGWEETITIFRILALGGAFWGLSNVSYWAFVASEKSRALLSYNLVSKPLSVVCIVIGSMFGLEGVAWGYTLGMALSWPLNLVWLARCAELPAWPFARNGLVIVSSGVLGFAVTLWLASQSAAIPLVVLLVVALAVGTATIAAPLLAVSYTREQCTAALSLIKVLICRTDKSIDNDTQD